MSSKDAFFFGHDSNAKDDPKIIQLIEEMGLEGYGIYWVLLELMRDQADYKYKLCLVPAIARRYNTTFEKVKSVITKYDLFVIEDDTFYSIAFINRMSTWDEKKKKRSEAGKKGNEARWGNKSQCDTLAITDGIEKESNAIAIKEKKEKEKKEKENKENINNIEQNSEQETENPKASNDAQQTIDTFFEEVWKEYPNKKGKSNISKTQKAKLYKLKDQLFNCIERYLKDPTLKVNGGFKELQHGSTFFNKGYLDWTDETYQENSIVSIKGNSQYDNLF